MSVAGVRRVGRVTTVHAELRKLPAFLRRDLITAWSYRMSFVTDWAALIVQVVIFNFVGAIIEPGAIPSVGGVQPTYLEFVAVGIAVSSFTAVGLGRIFVAIRQEQVQGTLESLLLTPTALTTIQIGSVVYDLLYVPIRTFLFLGLTTVVFGASFEWSGIPPTLLILFAFIPFVWGLGVMSAAWTLTFKRGTGIAGLLAALLTIGAGTYFPTDVLPIWAQSLFQYSPVTMALNASREALIGGASMADTMPTVVALIPFAVISMWIGVVSFRMALERERRRGSLGLY
jgi:ABC-2 type transport system permease protein